MAIKNLGWRVYKPGQPYFGGFLPVHCSASNCIWLTLESETDLCCSYVCTCPDDPPKPQPTAEGEVWAPSLTSPDPLAAYEDAKDA